MVSSHFLSYMCSFRGLISIDVAQGAHTHAHACVTVFYIDAHIHVHTCTSDLLSGLRCFAAHNLAKEAGLLALCFRIRKVPEVVPGKILVLLTRDVDDAVGVEFGSGAQAGHGQWSNGEHGLPRRSDG